MDMSIIQKMHSSPAAFVTQVRSDPKLASYVDDAGSTLLHHAYPYPEVVRALLEGGANPNAVDGTGKTPLHVATRWAALGSLRHLMEFGADPAQADASGATALGMASEIGREDVMRLLRGELEAERFVVDLPPRVSPPRERLELGYGCSWIVVIAFLLGAYIGFAALRSALQYRWESRELAVRGVATHGVVVDNVGTNVGVKSMRFVYAPVVAYRVAGSEYRRYTNRGSKMGMAKGVRVEVIYLPGDPAVARVTRVDHHEWGTLALFGATMMAISLALIAAGVLRRHLFIAGGLSLKR